MSNEGPESEKDAAIWMFQEMEETEGYRTIVACVSEGNDIEVKQKIQYWMTELQARPGADKGQMKVLECGIRWAGEARRKGRQEEQEQNAAQEQSKRGRQVRFGKEEESDEPAGRGRAGLVRG